MAPQQLTQETIKKFCKATLQWGILLRKVHAIEVRLRRARQRNRRAFVVRLSMERRIVRYVADMFEEYMMRMAELVEDGIDSYDGEFDQLDSSWF